MAKREVKFEIPYPDWVGAVLRAIGWVVYRLLMACMLFAMSFGLIWLSWMIITGQLPDYGGDWEWTAGLFVIFALPWGIIVLLFIGDMAIDAFARMDAENKKYEAERLQREAAMAKYERALKTNDVPHE